MSKNRLDFTANLGRHDHDVSQGYTSSIAPGCLVPQYFDIMQPGDKIFYKTHMFARFQDVNTAFLGEVDMHLDYFFVPLQMIYTIFGQMFAQTNDVISDFFDTHANLHDDNLPVADLNSYFSDSSSYPIWAGSLSPYNYVDTVLKGNFRLLDALDINPCVVGSSQYISQQIQIPHVTFVGFPAALAAYQAIYQKYFRNDELELFDIASFNLDSCFNIANLKIPATKIEKLVRLRYSGRPNDYFTNIRFSPIATSINSVNQSTDGTGVLGGSSLNFGNLLNSVSNFLGPSSSSSGFGGSSVNSSLGSVVSTSNDLGSVFVNNNISSSSGVDITRFTAQNIRAVFALDKYMRVYGRAGKTYDDQILAHFGVKIPHDIKHDLTHLKHYRMVLQSDPVMSTADTELGSVGSVGGQVAGELNTNEESFTAPVHGVFMCISHVVTHPRYSFTNSRLHAINNRLSFPIPEFDKLGAQPLLALEVCEEGTFGYFWLNRYQEFKQKYNRSSITFAHDYQPHYNANFFSPWVVSRMPYNWTSHFGQPTFKSFFESPDALDNVMVVKYNGSWSNDYIESPHLVMQTDPILTEYACFAKKVSWMSPTGEPDL